MKKAYYVCDFQEERGEIVFADNANQAKAWADLDCEYIDRRAKREPKYDQYADTGVPRAVLFDDGWWFTCDNCYREYVMKDRGGVIISNMVYCSECAAKKAS